MISAVLNILIILIFMRFIMRYARQIHLGKAALPALMLKVFAGLLVGLVFKHLYGGGDTFSYYREGLHISGYIRNHPEAAYKVFIDTDRVQSLWQTLIYRKQPRALFFSKIVALVHILTHANYWLMSVYFSLLSFLGSLLLVKQLIQRFDDIKVPAVIAFFYFPSVLFWSSGILKESVAIFSLYFMVALMLRKKPFHGSGKWIWVLGFLLSGYLLWKLRYFYLGVLIPLLIAAFVASRVEGKGNNEGVKKRLPWILYSLVAITFFIFISRMHYNLHHENFIRVLYDNYQLFTARSGPGSGVVFQDLQPDGWSFLIHAPKALFSGLFCPNIWQIHNVRQLPQVFENVFLLAISIISLVYVVKNKPRVGFWGLSAIIYIGLLSTLLVFASPNYGSLMRYRSGYLSFFVLLVLYQSPVSDIIKKPFSRKSAV